MELLSRYTKKWLYKKFIIIMRVPFFRVKVP